MIRPALNTTQAAALMEMPRIWIGGNAAEAYKLPQFAYGYPLHFDHFLGFQEERKNRTLTIYGNITIVHNPAAGSNRRGKFAFELARSINDARTNGALHMGKPIKMLETCADRSTRIASLAESFSASGREGLNYVLVVGGDGTFADAITAAAKSSMAHRTVVIPMKGGTANDFGRTSGAPSDPKRIIDFIRDGKILPLDVAEISINGETQESYLVHTLTTGASGRLFVKMEKGRGSRSGPFKNLFYLPGFFREIFTSNFFNAQLKNEVIPALEIVVLGCNSLGGVSSVPLPPEGFELVVPGGNPSGFGFLKYPFLATMAEVAMRKLMGSMGLSELALSGGLMMIDKRLVKHFSEGENFEIDLAGIDGQPTAGIHTLLNGDIIHTDTRKIEVRPLGKLALTMAAPHSDLAIRKKSPSSN